jgi:uncharacterized protein (TIGR03086 family)
MTDTSNAPPTLQLLQRAIDQVATVVSGVHGDQADRPTPCRSWSVRELVAHIGLEMENFTVVAEGGTPDWKRPPAPVEGDVAVALDDRRRRLADAWSAADPERTVEVAPGTEAPLISRADQQIAELCIHAWDLARATGQSEDLDEEPAERGLRWARGMLKPEYRGSEEDGRSFGPEVTVPADAPVYQRLAGWFGRDPGWRPGAP